MEGCDVNVASMDDETGDGTGARSRVLERVVNDRGRALVRVHDRVRDRVHGRVHVRVLARAPHPAFHYCYVTASRSTVGSETQVATCEVPCAPMQRSSGQ